MQLLFLGDIVGKSGRAALLQHLPVLVERHKIEAVVVNGENAAGGFGLTEAIFHDIIDAGADAVTLGNHAFDQREALVYIERAPNLVRPINYPAGTPGRGASLIETRGGMRLLVINAMGRVFMDAMEDPFACIDKAVNEAPLGQVSDAILIDIHAEATSEKQALAHYLDGRVSLVVGTHTHAPTADHRVLHGGTAYQSDVGMCGDYDSVIGMEKAEPIRRFLEKTPGMRFEPANGPATLCGIVAKLDPKTGLAKDCAPLRIGGALAPAQPHWWSGDK